MKRKINKLYPNSKSDRYKELNLREPLPLYQFGDETTTDVTKADKTFDGKPICVGVSRKDFKEIPQRVNDVSFNPRYPDARFRALQLRAQLNELRPSSTIYMDKFEASKLANDSISALEKSVNSINNNPKSDK